MKFVSDILRGYFCLITPLLLVLISVRLIMSPLFLRFEYYRFDFPEDIYGFTIEERMRYATPTLAYLLNHQAIDMLAELTFDDGKPIYTSAELRHMEDVKSVTRYAYLILLYAGGATLLLSLLLAYKPMTRNILKDGLFCGGILTMTLIGVIVMIAVLAWDTFFTIFHEIFFESGTWRFSYSDTLIRLFPERFWFDAALTVGILTAFGGGIITAVTWNGNPLRRKHL
ncbi:MAG: TIGR01906 family membrane protein [Phototrophicales bacterium]